MGPCRRIFFKHSIIFQKKFNSILNWNVFFGLKKPITYFSIITESSHCQKRWKGKIFIYINMQKWRKTKWNIFSSETFEILLEKERYFLLSSFFVSKKRKGNKVRHYNVRDLFLITRFEVNKVQTYFFVTKYNMFFCDKVQSYCIWYLISATLKLPVQSLSPPSISNFVILNFVARLKKREKVTFHQNWHLFDFPSKI